MFGLKKKRRKAKSNINKVKKLFKMQQQFMETRRDNYNNIQLAEVDKMNGVQFEQFLVFLFNKMGYRAEMTPTTGDYGCDLLITTSTKKIVVQAKRYTKSVGVDAVQEIVSSKPIYGATEAWVVTNNKFTKSAQNLAYANGVYLYDRNALADLMRRYL